MSGRRGRPGAGAQVGVGDCRTPSFSLRWSRGPSPPIVFRPRVGAAIEDASCPREVGELRKAAWPLLVSRRPIFGTRPGGLAVRSSEGW